MKKLILIGVTCLTLLVPPSGAAEKEEVILQGLVVYLDEDKKPVPHLSQVDRLPSDDSLIGIEGVAITFENSDGVTAIAKTGDDGRFTVKLGDFGKEGTASLTIARTGFAGVEYGNIRVGTGGFALKAGENLLLVKLPPAPCLLPKKEAAPTDEP